jgi:outer membrane protein OmpA-like peptidoglycan-associated protein
VDAGGHRLAGELEGALSSACRTELPGIYFAFNSAALDPASDRTIAALAEVLQRHPDWTATLEGHTDSIGTGAANLALSERRVATVRAQLVNRHGIAAERLKVIGRGSGLPRETNATVEGRARNRRVEMLRECANPGGDT